MDCADPGCSIKAICGPVACPAEDRYFGNADLASALALPAGRYDNLNTCGRSEDWYAYTLCAGGTLTGTIEFTHADGDIELFLYDADGNQRRLSQSGDDNEEVVYQNGGADDAVVYVVPSGNGANNTYDLVLSDDCP